MSVTDVNSIALLGCPFCGRQFDESRIRTHHMGTTNYSYYCQGCALTTPKMLSRNSLFMWWNKRTPNALNELASKWRKLSKEKSSNKIDAGFNLACSVHADALDHIIEQNAPTPLKKRGIKL